MLKAVIFDLGGTLFKKEDALDRASRAQWEKLKELGYEISWDKYLEVVSKASDLFNERYCGRVAKYAPGNFVRVFFEVWGEDATGEHIEEIGQAFWNVYIENQELIDGSREVIDYCRGKGLTLGVVTNGNRMMTEVRLRKEDIEKYFDHIVYSAMVGEQKSDLEPFRKFLEVSGLKGEECLMVGNRPDEDTHAKKVGMKTVILDSHRKCVSSDKINPDYTIGDIRELKEIVDGLV